MAFSDHTHIQAPIRCRSLEQQQCSNIFSAPGSHTGANSNPWQNYRGVLQRCWTFLAYWIHLVPTLGKIPTPILHKMNPLNPSVFHKDGKHVLLKSLGGIHNNASNVSSKNRKSIPLAEGVFMWAEGVSAWMEFHSWKELALKACASIHISIPWMPPKEIFLKKCLTLDGWSHPTFA